MKERGDAESQKRNSLDRIPFLIYQEQSRTAGRETITTPEDENAPDKEPAGGWHGRKKSAEDSIMTSEKAGIAKGKSGASGEANHKI